MKEIADIRLPSLHGAPAALAEAVGHYEKGDWAAALDACDRALAQTPESADPWHLRGVCLYNLRRLRPAIEALTRALVLAPGNIEIWQNRAVVNRDIGRDAAASADIDRALALATGPQTAAAVAFRGHVLASLGRHREALAFYDEAERLAPGATDARLSASMTRLLLGDFQRGWDEYEARPSMVHAPLEGADAEAPRWRGESLGPGDRLFLLGEQGLGDVIQFARYAVPLAAAGADVVLRVPAPLARLIATLPGVGHLDDSLPVRRFQCPLLSVPREIGTRLDTIPAPIPYLTADPAGVAAFEARLADIPRPRLGIAWSGSTLHPNDRDRSMPLATMLAALPPGFGLVSVQKDIPARDADTLRASPVRHLGADLGDFADTAALVACCDAVVAVDTSVVHLAGALGRPAHVLLHRAPDWRWLLDRPDSPWYPTLTLHRQVRWGDWSAAFASLRQALARQFPGL